VAIRRSCSCCGWWPPNWLTSKTPASSGTVEKLAAHKARLAELEAKRKELYAKFPSSWAHGDLHIGRITSDGAALITFAKAPTEVPVHPPDRGGKARRVSAAQRARDRGEGGMADPRAYRLILADASGDEHPDLRLVKFLRTLDKYGFTLANAHGSDPPSPGLLETITREHGDDAGLAERLERLETTAIKHYLVRIWSMTQADIDDMLGRCEADPTLRSRFLALGAGPGAGGL
jgi:hypothetical protein